MAAGLDAVYAPFEPAAEGFVPLVQGLRAGGVCGVNVTLPFKAQALALADLASPEADAAGAANLLLFRADGRIEARNSDGLGLLAAFAEQAAETDLKSGPVVILGAGGAARGAAAALVAAGAPELRIVNRTAQRAAELAERFGARIYAMEDAGKAFAGAVAIINSTAAELGEGSAPDWPLDSAPHAAAVMDMVYNPLETALLARARKGGRRTVDGLAMLIGQARPSFEAFYGVAPPVLDVRALLEEALT
jgi:shikimate dehydrogenase